MQGRPAGASVSQGSGFFISEDGMLVTNNRLSIGEGSTFTVIMETAPEA